MFKYITLIILGLLLGVLCGAGVIFYIFIPSSKTHSPLIKNIEVAKPAQVIGFLPYWLLGKASTDYSKYITTLSYFGLRIDKDGSILKLTNPTQLESGWYALKSGKIDPFLNSARSNNITLSLTIDSGDTDAINSFISNPASSAQNLLSDVIPIMQKYQMGDLNLDIEFTQSASSTARTNFTSFVKEVRSTLPKSITLTLEITPVDSIQNRLIDVKNIGKYADYVVIMAYDYHSPDSIVSGPVAPLNGAEIISEYDTASAVEETLKFIPPSKLILGIPTYGYEWETLGKIPRLAIIPGSGITASNKRAETFLSQCSTCSAMVDTEAKESYFSYLNQDTNTNHIIFFPDINSTKEKVDFAKKEGLGGLAIWALGYEGDTILNPLSAYKGN